MLPRLLRSFLLLALLAGLSTACDASFPRYILTPGGNWNAQTFDLFTYGDSSQHLAIEEVSTDGSGNPISRLVYAYIHQASMAGGGAVTNLLVYQPADAEVKYPDLVVTNSGTVYMTWVQKDQDETDWKNCIAIFLPDAANFDGLVCNELSAPNSVDISRGRLPRLVTDGELVAIGYYTTGELLTNLWVRTLSDPGTSAPVSTNIVGLNADFYQPPELAIDGSKRVHVAVMQVDVTDPPAHHRYYAFGTIAGGFTTDDLVLTAEPTDLSLALARGNTSGADDQVFVAYALDYASDRLVIECYREAEGYDYKVENIDNNSLPSDQDWRVIGAPDAIAGTSNGGATFAAYTNSTGTDREIFFHTHGTPSAHQVTYNDSEDIMPRAAVVAEELLVLLWRQFPGSGVYGDVYLFRTDQAVPGQDSSIRWFNSTDLNKLTDYELESNFVFASAAWLDRSPDNSRSVVYYGYNTELYDVYLPAVTR